MPARTLMRPCRVSGHEQEAVLCAPAHGRTYQGRADDVCRGVSKDLKAEEAS